MILSAIFSPVLTWVQIFYRATFFNLPQNEDHVSHSHKGTPAAVVLYTLTPCDYR